MASVNKLMAHTLLPVAPGRHHRETRGYAAVR